MVKRRTTLIGLAGIVAGSGAIISTGAFTSVEANRSVSVATEGDGSALIQLSPANTRAEQYVSTTDGTLEVDLSQGLNIGATSVFNPLITVTNNSDNDMDLGLELTGDTDMENYASFMINGNTGTNIVPADGTYSVPSGSSINFGLRFEIPNGADIESLDMNLTVIAKGK